MSVSFFSADELGNLARVCEPGASTYEASQFKSICESLATFSRANAATYNAQYVDGRLPLRNGLQGCTAKEIERAAPCVTRMDLPRAVTTAQLLEYNLATNAGDDSTATRDVLLAISHVTRAVMRRLAARAGVRA